MAQEVAPISPEERAFNCIEQGDFATVKELIKSGLHPNTCNGDGVTLLMKVVPLEGTGIIIGEVALSLINHGANINAQDKNGDTALHYAARSDGWVRLLCDANPDRSIVNHAGKTAAAVAKTTGIRKYINETPVSIMRYRARNNDVEGVLAAVDELRLRDPTPRQLAEELSSTLSVACYFDHFDLCEILLKQGEINLASAVCTAACSGRERLLTLLLDRGGRVNARAPDDYSLTPLGLAADGGHVGVMQILLDRGAKVNDETNPGDETTPLMVAASAGRVASVKFLIEHGADVGVRRRTKGGSTALTIASTKGYTEIVKLLLDAGAGGTRLYVANDRTALQHAAQNGHLAVVEALVTEEDGDIWSDDESGAETERLRNTDRGKAAARATLKGYIPIVEYLLDHAAMRAVALDEQDHSNTLLQLAARSGHLELVKRLLARGFAVDDVLEGAEDTPLMCAAAKGHMEVVRVLLAAGARADYATEQGETVVASAVESHSVEMVQLMLDAGGSIFAPATAVSKDKGDALCVAATIFGGFERDVEMFRFLIDRGAHVNEMYSAGPLLLYVCGFCTPRTVRLILAHGANAINVAGEQGITPLLAAIIGIEEGDPASVAKQRETLETLLEHGANPCVVEAEGVSPVRDVARRGMDGLARLLLDFGANPTDMFQVEDDEASPEVYQLLDYVPTPRVPRAVLTKVGDKSLWVMPWSPELHASAPRIFQAAARALCLLRSRGECELTWGSFPNEVFDMLICVMWREELIARQLGP